MMFYDITISLFHLDTTKESILSVFLQNFQMEKG